MSKRDGQLKLEDVSVRRQTGEIMYCCEEDSQGLVRFGIVRLRREISESEAVVIVSRLRRKRLSEVDQILRELLNAEIGLDVDFGDITPTD